VLESKNIETTVNLKIDGKWILDKYKLGELSDKTLWLIFDWDGKRRPQIL